MLIAMGRTDINQYCTVATGQRVQHKLTSTSIFIVSIFKGRRGGGGCTGNFLLVYKKQEVGAGPCETHLGFLTGTCLLKLGSGPPREWESNTLSWGVGWNRIPFFGQLELFQAALFLGAEVIVEMQPRVVRNYVAVCSNLLMWWCGGGGKTK